MTSIKIDDLETSSELDREAMVAISGGMGMGNAMMQGGIVAPVGNMGGGFAFASPTTIVSTPINVPIAIDLDLDTDLGLDTDVSSIVGSAFTEIVQ